MDHAKVMNSCDAKARRIGLAHLSATERVVVLVAIANFDVELGGLSSFFYNSAGDHAAETVTALETVGATRAAAALRAAIAKFPGGAAPANRVQRYPGWQLVSGLLGPLDREFGRDEPDVFCRLCEFIEVRAAELGEHGAGA